MTEAPLPPKIAPPYKVKAKERADLLFDYAVLNPKWTVDDIQAHFGWSRPQVNGAIRYMRETFADSSINLICTPNGQRNRWLYELVGTYDDSKEYVKYRVGDAESRLLVIESVTHSAMNASDMRTTTGKKAKLIYETLHYLRSQLEAMDDSVL